MSKTLKAVLLLSSVAVVAFIVIGGLRVSAASNDGAYRQLGVFSEVLSRIRTEYVEEPNIPQVTDGALHGLLESLDANSSYLTPEEYKKLKERQNEGKGNIGATISKRFGYAAVVSVLPGSAAAKSGVETGDIIEAIEGRSTREMSLAEIQGLLAGQVGSNLNVSIVRARRAEPLKVTITRDLVKYPPASEKMLQENIGYIKVDALPKGESQQIAEKIKGATSQGAKKLILDLRDTSDGDMNEGIAAANLFLDHGTITYLQGQKYPRETFTADPKKAITTLPVVVLVNRGTGGPAEVVAAALLENARADVVGDKTFGIGSIQKVINVPDGSALILSIAKYYTPNGKAIQDTAVTPNITVAENDDDFVLPDEDAPESTPEPEQKKVRTLENDQQLQRAIQVLQNKEKKAA
ncbi:MAG TPA: S41 family peptidase [Terriglobales bacterium]|nr:S41 family peptidase [Terriglobales bacterium]